MNKNPWTLERLQQYLHTEEGASVEFKSSRPFLDRKTDSGFLESLAKHVGGFLNGDGGVLLIGLEEENRTNLPDIATKLSPGVPRKVLSASRLESMLCDRIHPSVAGLVTVHPIRVGTDAEGDLLAFAVEIRPGVTAYQSPDKKYYVRRGYSSEAMEDKDIRLRMLAQQRARVSLTPTLEVEEFCRYLAGQGAIQRSQTLRAGVAVTVTNVGLKTVREFSLATRIFRQDPDGRQPQEVRIYRGNDEQNQTHWTRGHEDRPLYPDGQRRFHVGEIDVCSAERITPMRLSGTFICYLDDAPSERVDIDLTDEYRRAIATIDQRAEECLATTMRELVQTGDEKQGRNR